MSSANLCLARISWFGDLLLNSLLDPLIFINHRIDQLSIGSQVLWWLKNRLSYGVTDFQTFMILSLLAIMWISYWWMLGQGITTLKMTKIKSFYRSIIPFSPDTIEICIGKFLNFPILIFWTEDRFLRFIPFPTVYLPLILGSGIFFLSSLTAYAYGNLLSYDFHLLQLNDFLDNRLSAVFGPSLGIG